MWLERTHISQSLLSHVAALTMESPPAGCALRQNLAAECVAYGED